MIGRLAGGNLGCLRYLLGRSAGLSSRGGCGSGRNLRDFLRWGRGWSGRSRRGRCQDRCRYWRRPLIRRSSRCRAVPSPLLTVTEGILLTLLEPCLHGCRVVGGEPLRSRRCLTLEPRFASIRVFSVEILLILLYVVFELLPERTVTFIIGGRGIRSTVNPGSDRIWDAVTVKILLSESILLIHPLTLFFDLALLLLDSPLTFLFLAAALLFFAALTLFFLPASFFFAATILFLTLALFFALALTLLLTLPFAIVPTIAIVLIIVATATPVSSTSTVISSATPTIPIAAISAVAPIVTGQLGDKPTRRE